MTLLRALFTGLRALVYMSAFLLLWVWLALQTRDLDARLVGPLPAGVRPIGIGLMSLGGIMALSCVSLFVARGRGTPAPFDPPREFVTLGPYRWVRNPMYEGAFALLVGFGLYHRSLAMVLFAALAAVLAHAFVVLVEEPGLQRRFGAGYEEYRGRVHRWRPRRPGP